MENKIIRKQKNSEVIPIDVSNVKRTVEIPIKKINIEKVENSENKTADEKKEEIKKDYYLIITEKPQAALKIALALGKGKQKKLNFLGIPYYELVYDNKLILVASAAGHLFTLDQERKDSSYPIFDINWVPSFKKENGKWTKNYYQTLAKLCKNAKEIIIATDYDIEGEVIGLNIIRGIARRGDAKRMKFSTLTSEELEESYNKMMNTIDWPQAIAGETRHFLDWYYGINLSRALMSSIKAVGKFKIMSIGRVQGPALNLIVEREKEIRNFNPTPYWQVYLVINEDKEKIELKLNKNITKESELTLFKHLKGKIVKVKTEVKEQKLKPLPPFDLTSLQLEAYKFYGINPNVTLQIAQNLYLNGFISYPRTSSQKIPPSIKPKKIIEKLSSIYKETILCNREKPIEGKKSDPAHPSIYPTGEIPQNLSSEERKIYDLIVRRFLSCFASDALIENKIITAIIDNSKFLKKGVEIKEKGWLNIYKSRISEKEIPTINGEYKIIDSRIEEKMTNPPNRYTPASIIAELEKRNLGTKATRALIIQTLYDRGYIKGQNIEATELGISLIETLKKYSPIIIDEKLTRKFEKEIENILESKKNLKEKQKKIIEEAKEVIKSIANQFKEKEKEIGQELNEAERKRNEKEKLENEIIDCKNCGKGKLRLLYNKKSKRYFVACSNYPECKITFTLPKGLIKKSQNLCEKCNLPKLILIKKRKKPWEFCFNPQCKKES
ncbi:MAG: DNA topoisomerase I [Candidatus Pacearchaeota archaeon]